MMLYEMSIRSLQCKNYSSDAFLGVVNVNATNVSGKIQYFIDRFGCIENLRQIEIGMAMVNSVHICFRSGAEFLIGDVPVKNVDIILLQIYWFALSNYSSIIQTSLHSVNNSFSP